MAFIAEKEFLTLEEFFGHCYYAYLLCYQKLGNRSHIQIASAREWLWLHRFATHRAMRQLSRIRDFKC